MGVYSPEPDPPVYYQVVDTRDCVRYTDVSQAKWFMDRIQYAYGSTNPNLRFAEDGTTILWFGYYQLRLGDWLYGGYQPVTDEELRASQIRPVQAEWPTTDTTTQGGA